MGSRKCGKFCHPSAREAAVQAVHIRRRTPRRRRGECRDLLPYFCHRCKAWHVGHRRFTPEEKDRKRRQLAATGEIE